MTNRKAAALSGTLLARKGAARPAGFREPSRQDDVSEDLGSDEPDDGVLEPAEAVGFARPPTDGATLAPELLRVRSLEPKVYAGSTALSAGPRPGAQHLWDGEAEAIEISQERRSPWGRHRWRLIFVVAAILAAILVGLYSRASNPPEAVQDTAEVAAPPSAEQPALNAGPGTARATLPRLAVAAPPPPNPGAATMAARAATRPQEFAELPPASAADEGGVSLIRAGIGLAATLPRTAATSNDAFVAAPAKTQAPVPTRRTPPQIEARVGAERMEVALRLPQQKPDSPLGALLSDAGNGVFVQLGSLKTAVGAMREWDKLVREFPGVLSGRALKIERVALANRGAFYRIRTGPVSGVTQAQAICAKFAARDRGCLVVRK